MIMVYLIDFSKRVNDVIDILRKKHKPLLVVKEESYIFGDDCAHIYTLIHDCRKNHIDIAIITDSIETLRHPMFKACCIFPDGAGSWEKRSRAGDVVIAPKEEAIVNVPDRGGAWETL